MEIYSEVTLKVSNADPDRLCYHRQQKWSAFNLGTGMISTIGVLTSFQAEWEDMRKI